ncbi:hypothetical protein ACROYT_G000292 [Oculina patagonica]
MERMVRMSDTFNLVGTVASTRRNLQVPMDVDFDDIKAKCPAFDKNTCPYMGLVSDHKGLAKGKCPVFSDGCPFKNLNTVGEFVEKMTQMRNTCKGKAAYREFFHHCRSILPRKSKRSWMIAFSMRLCQ